ncbi:hypothetical protein [Peptoniphilus raoultii]|uniref:hypothetical protein n=1 Tax=Peptoniphilus raoultii TaxID=1776387 RepID=UPI0008DA06B2|nr:hypothetical protein [Peptoniphilus raoultii]
MDKKQISKQLMALFLSILMIVGILPLNIFAEEPQVPGTSSRSVDAEGKPKVPWVNKDANTDDGSEYWQFPEGVKVINGQGGNDPLRTTGINYEGKYLNADGNLVLRFNISQQQAATTGVWKYHVLRFPKEIYLAADWDKSYIVHRQVDYSVGSKVDFLKFTDTTIPNQQAWTKSIEYKDAGISYRHYEVNLVLKGDVNWAKDFADRTWLIQMRTFNGDGSKMFSDSTPRKKRKYTNFSYNTYTKTTVVGDKVSHPKDLIESTALNAADIEMDMVYTAYSTLLLDKINKKVTLVYVPTKNGNKQDYDKQEEAVAVRQTLDPDFIKYIDINGQDTEIGTVRHYNSAEKVYGKEIKLFAKDLNGVKIDPNTGKIALDQHGRPISTRPDKSIFLQIGSHRFVDRENAKLDATDPSHYNSKMLPKGETTSIYSSDVTKDGFFLVFEYNIDPEKISSDLITEKKFIKNFVFDTRYITSNAPGFRKFTVKTDKDINLDPDKKLMLRFQFDPKISFETGLAGNNDADDFMFNIGGPDGSWKSWKKEGFYWKKNNKGGWDYFIPVYGRGSMDNKSQAGPSGFSIDEGTELSVWLPTKNVWNKKDFNANEIKVDIVESNGKYGNALGTINGFTPVAGTEFTLSKVMDDKVIGNPKYAGKEDIFYNPLYMEHSVSRIGGSAIREQAVPIVDEIFTDDEFVTGIVRDEGGVLSTIHVDNEKNPKKKFFGSNWIELTKFDNNGNPTEYGLSDGKDKEQTLNPADIEDTRTYGFGNERKEYKGLKFKITKQYTDGADIESTKTASDVKSLGLIKDQAFVLNAFRDTSLNSEPIYEQVQAKVEFVTYPDKNVSLTRIVPLNKQYSVLAPVVEEDVEPVKNENYVPNGFLAKQGEDNIRVDETNKTVTLSRRSLIDNKDKNKKYANLINHDGYVYDINNVSEAIKKSETEAFIKRLYPDAEFDQELHVDAQGKVRTDGLSVIAWTTKPLTDINDFYKLEKDGKVLTTLDQWKEVDADTQTYIFNEYSPVDKNRKVYAVWGAPSLVLHSNNTYDSEGNFIADKETIVRIPYSLADETLTNQKIDQMTSATKDNLRKTNTIKQLPLAPYKNESKNNVAKTDENYDNYDAKLENFRMTGRTFVGWTSKQFSNITDADRYDESKLSEFVAGQNNVRIGEIKDGWTTGGAGKPKVSLPKNTETILLLQTDSKAYVPNGFSYSVNKSVQEIIKAGKDYHLYANYRDYFDITVHPQYKDIDTTQDPNHQYGKYKDLTDATKKKNLKIGILYRTAVTDYSTPTVLQQATYNPVKNGIQDYDFNFTTPLKWTEPGYDREGLRKSFISVVIPEGKENVYNNFKQPKTAGSQEVYDWADLGISTYVKINGSLLDIATNAPKNLHETDTDRDRYGDPLAKRQSFTIKNDDGSLDAYTSATSRQSLVREVGAIKEVKGYDIILTNTPETIPVPEFESVKESDTELKIKFSDDIKNNVDGLKLQIPQKNDGKLDLFFVKQQDGTFKASNGITATVQGNQLVIKTLDLTELPDDEQKRTIYGNYTKAINDGSGNVQHIDGKQAKVVITKLLPAYPVTNMYQVPNDDQGNTKIKFDIPQPGPTNQVVPGTKYQPQKWDKTQNKWVDCGDPYNVTQTGEGGKTVELTLTGVDNDDLIRIVSDEPGKKPAYSVGDETDTPYTPMKPNPNKPSDPVADTNHYVIVDKKGPTVTAKTEEEKFRRYIDLKATLDELPEGEIIIEYGTKGPKGTTGNQILKFENKALAFEKIKELVRVEDKTEIWITAKDKFGNSADTDVNANLSRVFTIQVEVPVVGDNYLMIDSSMAEATIEMTIKRKGQETKLKDVANIPQGQSKVNLLNQDGSAFTLEKRDTIIFKGTVKAKDGKADYTTNPFRLRVR